MSRRRKRLQDYTERSGRPGDLTEVQGLRDSAPAKEERSHSPSRSVFSRRRYAAQSSSDALLCLVTASSGAVSHLVSVAMFVTTFGAEHLSPIRGRARPRDFGADCGLRRPPRQRWSDRRSVITARSGLQKSPSSRASSSRGLDGLSPTRDRQSVFPRARAEACGASGGRH